MSAQILLDTALLAVPNYAESPEAAEDIIFKLKHWADMLVHFGNHFISRSSDAEMVLGEHGFLPISNNISDLIEVVGLSGVYNTHDVWKSYNTILNRSALIVDSIGLEAEVLDDCVLTPDLLAGLCPDILVSHTKCALTTAVLAREQGGTLAYVSSSLPASPVDVTATVTVIRGGDETLAAELPKEIKGVAHLVSTLEEVVAQSSPDILWREASSPADIYFAIASRCVEIQATAGMGRDFRSAPIFVIGSDFVASLARNSAGPGSNYGGVVLDSSARLLLGSPKEELKAFKKPKRRRDQAEPLRTHLTKGSVGLRLMVWRRPDGLLELANVGPKWEEEIAEGDSLGEFRVP